MRRRATSNKGKIKKYVLFIVVYILFPNSYVAELLVHLNTKLSVSTSGPGASGPIIYALLLLLQFLYYLQYFRHFS